jgi:hypothetical protein
MAGGGKNKDNRPTKRKSGGDKDKDEDHCRMKLNTASSRRANATENPHIPRPQKKEHLRISDVEPSAAAPEP